MLLFFLISFSNWQWCSGSSKSVHSQFWYFDKLVYNVQSNNTFRMVRHIHGLTTVHIFLKMLTQINLFFRPVSKINFDSYAQSTCTQVYMGRGEQKPLWKFELMWKLLIIVKCPRKHTSYKCFQHNEWHCTVPLGRWWRPGSTLPEYSW